MGREIMSLYVAVRTIRAFENVVMVPVHVAQVLQVGKAASDGSITFKIATFINIAWLTAFKK